MQLKNWLLAICCQFPVILLCQLKVPVTPFQEFLSASKPARAVPFSTNTGLYAGDGLSSCDNYTFLLRIKAASGEKIEIVRLATTAKNTFIVAGNYRFTDGHQEGVLIEVNPAGDLIAQQRIQVQNRAIFLQDLAVTSDGGIFITGFFQDGAPEFFIGRWDYSLNPVWTYILQGAETPKRIKLDINELNNLVLAIEQTNAIQYCSLGKSGALLWFKRTGVSNLTQLVGFHQSLPGENCLVLNVIQNGRPGVQLISIDETTGNVVQSAFSGNGSEKFIALAASGFNFRVQVGGWRDQNTNNFIPIRDAVSFANQTEYRYSYTLPNGYDAAASAAISRAGDGLCYFFPASQSLFLIRHIAESSLDPDYGVSLTIPNGKTVQAICGTYDNGYLTGLNSADSSEIILVKTDSTGKLLSCGSASVTVGSAFQQLPVSSPAGYSSLIPVSGTTAVAIQQTNTLLAGSYDCRDQACPPPPAEDTCLATFTKQYKSSILTEILGRYFLMKDNKHVYYTIRLDNLFGAALEATYGFRLVDERGNVQKVVSLYDDKGSFPVYAFKLSDTRLLLLGNPSVTNQQAISIQLMDENLNLLWHKSIMPSEQIYSSGFASGFSDATMDSDGNIYLTGTHQGFGADSAALVVYKVDQNGNPVWLKYLKTMDANFGPSAITVSSKNVHVVIECFLGDNISVSLDKSNGQLINANSFPIRWNNTMFTNLFFYYNGYLYYSGSNNASELALVKFDSTGKVIQIREAPAGMGTITRNAAFRDGYLFSQVIAYENNTSYRCLIKVDTNLDVKFINYYPSDYSLLTTGLYVSPQQYIYMAGTTTPTNYLANSGGFLIKLDSLGNSGTCPKFTRADFLNRSYPSMKPSTFLPGNLILRDSVNTSYLVTDTTAMNVGSITCISSALCNTLDLGTLPAICQLNVDYSLPYTRNAGCMLKPAITADTSYIRVINITDTTIVLQFRKNGNTRLKALLNTGCTFYTDSIDIAIQEVPITISLGSDTLLCPGDTLKLHAGPGYSSYKWQDGSTDSTFTVRGAGTYYVEIQNSCGDKRSDSITVAAAIVPSLTLGPDLQICEKDTAVITASPGFVTYNWEPSSLIIGSGSSVQVVPKADLNISVTAITVNGCKTRDTVSLSLKYPPIIRLGNDTSFCQSDSIMLHAGTGFLQYQWSTGASTEQVVVRQAGIYSVAAKAVNGCFAKDTLQVLNVFNLPVVNLGADRSICENTQLILNPGNFASYRWQDNSIARVFTVSDTGWYSVRVTDLNGCVGTDSIRIPAKNPNPAGFLNQTDTLCAYDKLEIVPRQTYSTYAWSTGNVTNKVTITKGGLYSLTVTDSYGCKGTDSILVIEKQCLSGMFLPNAFTPNKDGRNDLFRAKAYGPLVSFELNVYNRYGQLVFSTKDSNRGWDGTLGGAPAEMGNYAWTCTYQFVGREKEFQRGFVLLLH